MFRCYSYTIIRKRINSCLYYTILPNRQICVIATRTLKLLKTSTVIWFNKMCKIKHLKVNYFNNKEDLIFAATPPPY